MRTCLTLTSRSLSVLLLAAALLMLAPAATAQQPVPGFAKSFTPNTIGPGSVSTLRFTITNSTGVGVRNLAFTDNLPAGMTIATPSRAASTCSAAVLDASPGGGTVSLLDGGVAASGSCTVTVNVTSSTPGTHTNTSGDLTSDAGNSGPAIADLTVATDRPGFRKSFSPASIFFNGRSTLTFTIDNTANAAARINIRFSDTLPSGMRVASPANRSTTCTNATVTAPAGATVISFGPTTFPGASVAAGATCIVRVDVIGGAIGALGNVSDDMTTEPPPFGGTLRSSGKASAVLTVSVERISLDKSFLDDPTAPGGTVTLRFSIRNLDRDLPATDIAFTDDLDAVLPGLAATGLPASNVCGTGSQLTGTSVITLSGGNLPPEGICNFNVTVEVPTTALAGTYSNVSSAVTATLGAQTVTGDPASDLLFIEASPLLTKQFLNDPVGAGDSVTLEFTITNTSLDQALSDIEFEDVFDVVLPTASAVPAAGFCGAGSTATYFPLTNPSGPGGSPAQLIVSGANLAAGASCTFSITLNVAVGAAGGTYGNITSDITGLLGGESPVTGDPAKDDLLVVAAPELLKEFTDDPVAPGDMVTLQLNLTHFEDAPGDATGIAFSDNLDAALSGLVATGLPMNDVCGTGSMISGTMTLMFTGGTLSPGTDCTFSVTLQVPATAAAGSHTNTTSAVAATVLGVSAMASPASDDLRIAGLTLTKEFTNDPALPGATVDLSFTIQNVSPASDATDIFFTDNLDNVLDGLAANPGLPLNDVCGTGSSLSATAGNTNLVFQGGSLVAGDSCTFSVTLQIPAATEPDVYTNRTTGFRAMIDEAIVTFDNANDELTVAADLLALTKEFTNDPVGPGDSVNLRFVVTNLSTTDPITDINFTDDLSAALAGLVSTSGTVADVCGVGSQLDGVNLLSLTGGTLAAGGSCSFNVALAVPASVPLGTIASNITSSVSGFLGTLVVRGDPASDTLRIDFVDFTKSFSGPVGPGDVVTLTFTVENLSTIDTLDQLTFSDDLEAVLTGLQAIDTPQNGICGMDSLLAGGSVLSFTGGSLLPEGSCTFSVDLQVPAGATSGFYLNQTSDLQQAGTPVSQPATDTLAVVAEVDDDGDGVLNGADVCPGTVIPEGVPTIELKKNRYALVDGDTIFDRGPGSGGPGDVFTTTDTAGCSCEQIIEEQGLGNGHVKFGCSIGAMREWVKLVSSSETSRAQRRDR